MIRLSLLPVLALWTAGCANTINRVTTNRIIPTVMKIPDLGIGCSFGNTVSGGIAAVKPNAPPDRASLLAYAAAGICAEMVARDARLDSQLLLQNLDNPGRVALSTDARLRSERHYTLAARRYDTAWQQTVDTFGLDCKNLRNKDEGLYLLGLIAGDLALIADAAAGNPLAIPQNTILEVGRGAACLDDEKWWGVPSALRAAAWATVPGSAPEDTDPWQVLEEAAGKGDRAGVRIARALQVFTAANAGRQDVLEAAIIAHGEARNNGDADPAWVLLDEYALSVSMFESDQIWINEKGHRTETFGTLPGASTVGEDPFGTDPFGTPDPFGAPPPSPEETP